MNLIFLGIIIFIILILAFSWFAKANTQKISKNITKLKFGSFKSWDSLNHLNLLLLIENNFKIKFTLMEMSKIKSIKD